jgi:acyl-CoA synthetase (AMP-forming)/AMP-acid ligase II
MDVTPYLALRSAPQVVFDHLAARRARPRFMLPTADGDWRAVTWGAFARQIREVASFLSAGDVSPGDRGAVFAPNRVEWAAAALALQAAGGVMVPIYPASTAEQAAYVASHSDARVVFVDTPALLARVFEAWAGYEAVTRIVTLDDGLDARRVLHDLRAKGKTAPSDAWVEARLISWSEARARGAARDREQPSHFEGLLGEVDADASAMMLVDNNEKAGEGSFKLRLIDAWQSTQSLNVYIVANGKNYKNSAPAAKNIRYRSVTTYLTGTSGEYDIVVTGATTGDVLAILSGQVFDSENVYTMVIAQSPTLQSAPRLELIDDSKDS